jgi:hypothetical protein
MGSYDFSQDKMIIVVLSTSRQVFEAEEECTGKWGKGWPKTDSQVQPPAYLLANKKKVKFKYASDARSDFAEGYRGATDLRVEILIDPQVRRIIIRMQYSSIRVVI